MPNYATIDRDERIPFWRKVGEAVHQHDCKFILQLSHGGRQRDIPGIEYAKGQSSTSKADPLHGFECKAMTTAEITETVNNFAEGARRAPRGRPRRRRAPRRERLPHYAVPQLRASTIETTNTAVRYENRARFVIEIVKAIRKRVGNDFHLQMKISATEHNNDLAFLEFEGRATRWTTRSRSASWLVDAGIDSVHVSTGSSFPHPKNPAGSGPAGRRAQPGLRTAGVQW